MMKTYKQELKQLEQKYQNDKIRLKQCKPLFAILKEYANQYQQFNPFSVYHPGSLELHVTLTEKHESKEVLPLVDAMIKDPRLEMISPYRNYSNHGLMNWKFTLNDTNSAKLQLNVWYGQAKTCHLIKTGETQDIYKYICDDMENGKEGMNDVE